MSFKVKDLTFQIKLDDQVMEYKMAHKTAVVVAVAAGTCGPTNAKGAYVVDYEIGFANKPQFDQLKAELHKLLDELDKMDVVP
jgi:NCAIR mutase (PurE)-related protein